MIVVYDETYGNRETDIRTGRIITRESLDYRVSQARDMYAWQMEHGHGKIASKLLDEIDRLVQLYDEIVMIESLENGG